MRLKTPLSLMLTFAILLTLAPQHTHAATTQGDEKTDDASKGGLRFRLSEGSEKAARPTPNAVATAAPLSEAETERLLARLPPTARDAGDAVDFRLRESSQPPPRAGRTIRAGFAEPESSSRPRPPRTDAPLEVLRFEPQGDVEL